MNFHVEKDGAGRECIFSDTSGMSDRYSEALVLGDLVYDAVNGHAFTVDPQKHALNRLSPHQAKMLEWYEKERGRAVPNIFAGEPPVG